MLRCTSPGRFATINAWAGSVTVTPEEAADSVDLKYVQYKNTKAHFVDTGGTTFYATPESGEDSGFDSNPASVSGNIVNVSGGDSPGIGRSNWSAVQTMSATFHFNLYLRYSIPDAGVPFKTVGKVFWKWDGTLNRNSANPTGFSANGGSTTATGTASTESPQNPAAP